MSLIGLGTGVMRGIHVGILVMLAGLLAACAQIEIPPHLQPLSKDAMMLLGKKGMRSDQPIFVRIFKEESELEIWKQRDDGRYYHFKTYPICNWSGELGPKMKEGDRQAPEGFYRVARHQMNPNSQFHLAYNLGYPNAYDRAHGRTGEFLMVHGKCKSAGCYAMTDALIEEIYALSREAFIGGQDGFEVHAFPFRMTDENMARHRSSPHYAFWQTLKEGYDYFELTRTPPAIAVCEKSYLVNVKFRGVVPAKLGGGDYCPPYDKQPIIAFTPIGQQVAEERVVAPGPKMRSVASIGSDSTASGLTNPAVGTVSTASASPGWRSVSRALGFAQ